MITYPFDVHTLIYDYFGVDLDKVWLTAIEDLPVLQQEVDAILSTLSE